MSSNRTQRQHLRFALALHGSLAGHNSNSCVSPYSVGSALGLVTSAARGATAAEPAALLAGSVEDLPDHADLFSRAARLRDNGHGEDPVLTVSNTVWTRQGLVRKPDFTDRVQRWPSARVATAPFTDDPEGARRDINRDVARTTRDLIPELLPPGTIRADTVASVVNALYLRTAWRTPFGTTATRKREFHTPTGPRRVPMMRHTERFPYVEREGWQVVTLPAVGDVDAVVVLPPGPLSEYAPALTAEWLAGLLSATRERMVSLTVPRLSLDVGCELKPALRALGVHTMFTGGADFTALADDPRLLVSDFLHQAVLRMDEGGLEGAAATAAVMRMVAMPAGRPVTVEVNRPFFLLVRHVPTGAVYFLAQVVQP